ncbi:MAG: hypothetical protein JO232_06070 [Verrucomicrobia bacterium]|nr:hypothetical protein [Verrucomicrobiota bacterium]
MLLYPLVFILAVVGTVLLDGQALARSRRGLGFLGVSLLGLTLIDQAAVGLSMSKRDCKRRVAKMEAVLLQARGNRVDSHVFWVNQKNGDAMFIQNLDIMLAGQALGVNVVNGYSGLAPKGYPPGMDELEGDCCNELRLWAGLHPGKITNKSLVQVGHTCQLSDSEFVPLPVSGFRGIEIGTPIHVWATDRYAEMKVPGAARKQGHEIVSFDLATLNTRTIKISTSQGEEQTINLVPGQVKHVELTFSSQVNRTIKFETDTEGVRLPNAGTGALFFDLLNPSVRRVQH